MKKFLFVMVGIFTLVSCKPTVKVALTRGSSAMPFIIMQKDFFSKVNWELVFYEDEELNTILADNSVMLLESDPIFLQENFSKNEDMMLLWSLPSEYGLVLNKNKTEEDLVKDFIGVEENGISEYLLNIFLASPMAKERLIFSNKKRYNALSDEKIAGVVLSSNYLQKALSNGYTETKIIKKDNNIALLLALKPIKSSLYKKIYKDYSKGLERFRKNSNKYKDIYKKNLGYNMSEKIEISDQVFYDEELFNKFARLYKMKNPVANVASYKDLFIDNSKPKKKKAKKWFFICTYYQ